MDKRPAFIPVTTTKKTKAKKRKLNNASAEPAQKSQDDEWPQSLKDYVENAFCNCLPGKRSELENELREIIVEASKNQKLYAVDWNERPLPRNCGGIKNPKSKKKITPVVFSAKPNPAAGITPVADSPEERRRREMRAKRFQDDRPVRSIDTSFENLDINEGADWKGKAVVGTSLELEKPYFRLTSTVDPSTVRPLPVLKKAFEMLEKRWKSDQNYSYICEQFKSMRQDLTVQCIQTPFTVKVYETHARIALEKSDLGEYNQCQTQLKYLYAKNIPGNTGEFTAYRILYYIFSRNREDLNSLLEEMAQERDGKRPKRSKCVKHALLVRASLATGNYHRFFRLYHNAPYMSAYLMDHFVGRERTEALKILCKAYQMGIQLTFITEELGFFSLEELHAFLSEHGVAHLVHSDGGVLKLNTKAALPILIEYSRTQYGKVDLKGQI